MPQRQDTETSRRTASTRSTKQRADRRATQGETPAGPEEGESSGAGLGRMSSEAASQMGEAARHAGRQARETASSFASQANEQVIRLADQQVSVGANLVSDVAGSVRAAADALDQNVPQLAQLARSAADRIEGVSESIRDQSAAEIFQATAELARRRPALVFGAAAAVGFLTFRLLTAGSVQDEDDFDDDDWDEWEEWDDDEPSPALTAGSVDSAGAGMRPSVAGQFGGRQADGE
jgi:hypothetical protein